MQTTSIRTLTVAATAALMALSFGIPVPSQAQTQPQGQTQAQAQPPTPQRFRASAALTSHVPGDKSVSVEISIDRWSTDDERQTLLKTFHRGGITALQEDLDEAGTVGTLRTPDGTSWDLVYAVQAPHGKDGRRIFLATEQPVELWAVYDNTGSTESLFTFLEIRLDEDGKGQGRIARASDVELSSDGRYLQLDDYGAQPTPLQNVQRIE